MKATQSKAFFHFPHLSSFFLIFPLPKKTKTVQDNHSQSSMAISPWEGWQVAGHEVALLCRMRVVGELLLLHEEIVVGNISEDPRNSTP